MRRTAQSQRQLSPSSARKVSPAACGWAFRFCGAPGHRLKTPEHRSFSEEGRCQTQLLLNARGETKRKANHRAHRPENLFGKKWITSAKASMAQEAQSKPSRLACRRPGEPALS